MIDIENEIFDELSNLLETKVKGINIVGEEQNAPAIFPTVSIVETDNFTSQSYADSSEEAFAEITYTINIYTNSTQGKKAEAKKVLTEIDKYMLNKGFSRKSKQPVSMNNSTIYRLVVRYSGVVSNDKDIYRR